MCSKFIKLIVLLSLLVCCGLGLGLVPKLTEKAKSIYLEIPDPAAQNYEESKSIIIKGYQLTADHYRYRFRTTEKKTR